MSPIEMYWTYVEFLCNRYGKSPQFVTNASGSFGGSPRIMIASEADLIESMDKGFREYAGAEWVWAGHNFKQYKIETGRKTTAKGTTIYYNLQSNMTGIISIWMLALHEFAHVIDNRVHLKRAKTRHDRLFQNILATLIRECPYEEFLEVIDWNPVASKQVLQPEAPIALSIDAILAKYKQP